MQNSEKFEVDFYFSLKIFNQIGKNQTHIFLTENTTLLEQLSLKKYDLIVIGTVHRYFNVFNNVAKKFNTSVIVHNINFTKVSRFQLFKNIFKEDVSYRLKLLLKEGLFSAPKVYQNASNLLVLDKGLTTDYYKFFPNFHTKNFSSHQKSIITVVIPGAVSQFRRDYKGIINKLIQFKSDTHFQFYFLGKAVGKELVWLHELEKRKKSTISLKYFDKKVTQILFEEIMRKADILWCPIQNVTEFFGVKEIYGRTKMSGNVGDAIKFAKQAIFPPEYNSKYPFLIPESENVEEQILSGRKDFFYDFQENFGYEKIKKDLEKTLQSLL